MEDSVEIIIYIIAVIIALVTSIVRAQNKRRQGENHEPPRRNIFFPELETEPYEAHSEEDMSNESDNKTGSRVVFETVEEEMKRRSSDIENTEKKKYVEGEAIFRETKNTLLSDEITDNISISELLSARKDKDEEIEEADEEEIDWKDAVIHSEILNRKEF